MGTRDSPSTFDGAFFLSYTLVMILSFKQHLIIEFTASLFFISVIFLILKLSHSNCVLLPQFNTPKCQAGEPSSGPQGFIKLLSQKPSQPEQQQHPHLYAAVLGNTPQPPLNLTPDDQKLSLFSSPPPSSAAPSSTTPPLLPNLRSSTPTTSPLTQ